MKLIKPNYWVCQLFAWCSYIVAYTCFYFAVSTQSQPLFFAYLVSDATIGILLTHIMKKFISNMMFVEEPIMVQPVYLLLTTLIFSILFSIAGVAVDVILRLEVFPNKVESIKHILAHLFGSFLLLTIWNIVYFAYQYIRRSRFYSPDAFKTLMVNFKEFSIPDAPPFNSDI